MSNLIRPETPSDIVAIHDVTVAAFLQEPHTEHTEQFIVEALRKAGALTISLVAEEANKVIGHVAVSPISISDNTTDWYGLGPISVSPELQKQGIGSALMNSILSELRNLGAAGCVLLGEPSYYSRFGFKPEANLVLPGVPQEYFQALSFSASMPNGTVTYHEAFNAKG